MGKDVPHAVGQVLQIVQVASNLTSMQPARYVELSFARQGTDTRLVGEVMNLTGPPGFVGRLDEPWPTAATFRSGAVSISPLSAPRATTAGVSLRDARALVLFVAEVQGMVQTTTTAVLDVMTEAKRRVLQASGAWMETCFSRLAQKVYRCRGAPDGNRSPFGYHEDDVRREMVVGAVEDFHQSVLKRRPIVGPATSLDHRLIDEIRRGQSGERPPIDFVKDEIISADATVIHMAHVEDGFDSGLADMELIRWFSDRAGLTDLERYILHDRFEDPRITDTALAKRYRKSRQTVWTARRRVKQKADALGIRGLIM